MHGPLEDVFTGVHALPFFHPIDGADAGFDPIDHTKVDPRLGTWADVAALGEDIDLVADLIVNHISSESSQFRDFLQKGDESRYSGMFLTLDKVFPDGVTAEELLRIYRPRPGLPFTPVQLADRSRKIAWTTFTPHQIDLDVTDPETRRYLDEILERFDRHGIDIVRLDAVGYAVKTAGTSCFMTPETFAFIDDLTGRARERGIDVLVEVHSHFEAQVEIARRVDWVYDFAVPALVLHSLFARDARALRRWLQIRPHNAVTVLDTHDGIGVVDVGPDATREGAPGLLDEHEIDMIVEGIHDRSRGESRLATGSAASNVDIYQVNCTFYDALGADDRQYLLARMIQLFLPGIPQIYYVGLLAGRNDMDLLARTGVGRDINRHRYLPAEITEALERPVVQQLIALIRLRTTHPAFSGTWELLDTAYDTIAMRWTNGDATAELGIDLQGAAFELSLAEGGARKMISDPDSL